MSSQPLYQRGVAFLALAAWLTGCSAAQPNATAFVPQTNGDSARSAGVGAQPDTGPLTYVASFALNEILGFPLTANGNVSPTVKIAGSKTKLNEPSGLAIDPSSGKIFVVNGGYQDRRILIFPKSSNGNVAPAVLGGSNVPVQSSEGLAVDSSGRLYVSDYTAKAIYVFAAGATGNTAPIRTIAGSATGLTEPVGMSLDSHGHLYVAQLRNDTAPIEEFAANANGNAAPIATIGGNHTKLLGVQSVVLDKHDRIIVPNSGSVDIFAAGSQGNVAPTKIIKGSNTTIVDPVTAGTDPNASIYVTNTIDIQHAKYSLIVFDSNANGNVAPARIISGSHTDVIDTIYPTTF
jgi:hypothetical protein